MQKFHDYLNLRAELSADLDTLSVHLLELGGKSHSKQLQLIKSRLLRDDFRILICGEFKRGKSCLVNAMLGDKILPMKVAPCTAVVTEVTYGPEPIVEIHPIEGEVYTAPIESLMSHIAIPKEGKNQIHKVQLQYPLDLCKNAVTLIDSPGLNEHWERTEISLEQIAQADALVMVLSCEMALSRSEIDFIRTHLGDRNFGLFFIWNRFDAIRGDHDEIAALDSRSKAKLNPYGAEIYCMSAREALIARRTNDASLLDTSGLMPFMNGLEHFLANSRGQTKLKQPIASLIHITNYALNTLHPRKEHLLKAPLEDLQAEEERARPRLEALERRRLQASSRVQRSAIDLVEKFKYEVAQFVESASDKAYLASQSVQFSNTAGRQERQDQLKRWYQKWLKESLSDLTQTVLTPLTEATISGLESDLRELLTDFQTDLRAVVQFDNAQIDIEHLLQDDWLKEIPLFISTAAALLLMGISSGAIAVSLLGLGALRAWLSGILLGKDDRRRIANAFGEELKKHENDMFGVLKTNIEDLSHKLANRIDQQLTPLIQDAEQQLTHAIQARKEGESEFQQERINLESNQIGLETLRKKYTDKIDANNDP